MLLVCCICSLAIADSNIRKAILGKDPRFDATISTPPIDQFIKNVYRPPSSNDGSSALTAPYEEVAPIEGNYYRNEGRYYEESPSQESLPEETKDYYEDGGR